MRNQTTKQVALVGVLFALAIVLSLLEGVITPVLGLPPGIKPGLANIVVMFAIMFIDNKSAVMLVILKALFAMLTRGVAAGTLSICGGLLSVIVMIIFIKIHTTLFIASVSGAVMHNIGQLIALNVLFTQSAYTWYYLPVLMISGLVMGSITAIMLKIVMPALNKFKLNKNNYQ